MSRTLSPTFISGVYAQETDEVVVCLLTVTHVELTAPIYLSSDPTARISNNPLMYGTESRSKLFLFLPFEFTLPDETSDSPPRVQLSMDNTDRNLVAVLRSISTPADIKVEIVLASDPDYVEITLPALQLGDVTIEDNRITANLVADNLINEPHPAGSFTPGSFPGLF